MKKLFFLGFAALALAGRADDKVHIVVPASYTGDAAVSRQALTLTPLAPLPRTYGSNIFSKVPIGRTTDTSGVCVFSNILWGSYRLDIPGNPGTSFPLLVGTNLSGLVNVAVLITNVSTLPPNPATNYYTQAQIDALLASTPTLLINGDDGFVYQIVGVTVDGVMTEKLVAIFAGTAPAKAIQADDGHNYLLTGLTVNGVMTIQLIKL